MSQQWRERMGQPSIPTLVAAGTPPAATTAAPAVGIGVAEWVQLLMLGYTVVLIVIALPKLIDAIKDLRRRWLARRAQ